jgi:hypothetical protein
MSCAERKTRSTAARISSRSCSYSSRFPQTRIVGEAIISGYGHSHTITNSMLNLSRGASRYAITTHRTRKVRTASRCRRVMAAPRPRVIVRLIAKAGQFCVFE